MLTFKQLSEKKKTPCKINPKIEDIKEKSCDSEGKKKCPKCKGEGCKHCGGTGYHDEDGEGADMSEAKKKDDSYLEVNFKKRQKNNEKARKEMDKVPGQKNPHFESKENSAYVSQEEVSEESTEEVAETETLLTFKQFNEGRAEDAKKSLDAVKKRQGVLDAHEKKTGKKLDITKTPEHKDHKKNFPGAKRTGKKVKGQKETPQETQNRRINKSTERIVKKGYTSKEKKEVKAMAKHASRFD